MTAERQGDRLMATYRITLGQQLFNLVLALRTLLQLFVVPVRANIESKALFGLCFNALGGKALDSTLSAFLFFVRHGIQEYVNQNENPNACVEEL